jgi:hypothetical protein
MHPVKEDAISQAFFQASINCMLRDCQTMLF